MEPAVEDAGVTQGGPGSAIVGWLLAAGVAAILFLAFAYGDSWSEAQTMRYVAGLSALVGVGLLLADRYPDRSLVYRYLARAAQRTTRRLSGAITGGKPAAAGWLSLALAAILGLGSFLV